MEYKVLPIVPVLKGNETSAHVAQDLENTIKKYHSEGWEYIRIEHLKIWAEPSGGCFGFGQTPGHYVEKQMLIFKK